MGELFDSFEDSWAHLLAREEPLESFLAGLPDDERAAVAVWLIPLEPALAPRAHEIQDRLPRLDWLRPLPGHFLHVSVAGLGFLDESAAVPELLERGAAALRGLPPFRMAFPRLNCFHEAVVAEVESDRIAEAGKRLRSRDEGPFLPHLSLAYTWAPGPAEPVREALVPIRETHLGEQDAREIQLCVVPASKTTIFEPWTVAGRVALRGDY